MAEQLARAPRSKGSTAASFMLVNSILAQLISHLGWRLDAEQISLVYQVANVVNPVFGAAARDWQHMLRQREWSRWHVPLRLVLDPAAALLG